MQDEGAYTASAAALAGASQLADLVDAEAAAKAEANLTGDGATIQALRNATVASNGTFNDCPEEAEVGGEGEAEPTPGEIVGFDNRLVN